MTTTDAADVLAEQMRAERAEARRQALQWMQEIAAIDEQLAPLSKAREQIRGQLKQYMELNADQLDRDEKDYVLLLDGDRGEAYVLQTSTKHAYDLVSAAVDAPAAVISAARAGWLKADHTLIEKHPGASWVDALKRFHSREGGPTSLVKKGR